MSWINAKPPIQYAEVDTLIQHVEASTEKLIDGVVLATALKFAYSLGLKKKEILGLRVGHVFAQSFSPLTAIRLFSGSTVIQIPSSFTPTILNYLPRLQNLYGAGLSLNAPLFPGRNGNQYDDTSFSRHLDHFARSLNIRVNLEKIRQTGICKFYDDLRATQATTGMASYTALSETARFARRGPRHTEGILTDQIQQWGGKPKPVPIVQSQISVNELTLRLKNNTLPSETEIMEIIERLYGAYIPSLNVVEEFRTELANAVKRNSSLNAAEISTAFNSQLDRLEFAVNPEDGKLCSLVDRLWDE